MTQTYGGQLQVGELLNILRRRWKIVAVCALTSTALVIALGMLVPPNYTAKTQLVLDPKIAEHEFGFDDTAVETLAELLHSPSHLRHLRDSLAADPIRPPHSDFAKPILTEAGEAIGRTVVGLFGAAKPTAGAAGDDRSVRTDPMPDLQELGHKLKSFRELRSRLVAVTFTWTDADIAAAIANRSVALFLDESRELRSLTRERVLEALHQRIPLARAELSRAVAAFTDYRDAHGLADADPNADRASQIDAEIADLNRELAIASIGLAARRSPVTPDGVMKDPSPAAPLRRLRSAQMPEPDGAMPDPGTAILQSRLSYFAGRLATLQKASAEARVAQSRLRELRLDAVTAANIYASLLQQQAELRDNPIQPEVRVTAIAAPPEVPNFPDPIFLLPPALVAGAIAGGLLAILRERVDGRAYDEATIEAALGVRCLGLVPKPGRAGRRNPARELSRKPRGRYSSAIRSIAAVVLELGAERTPGKVLLFTSSLEQEGKTTLAVSFAACAALLRRTVLVIDFNVRSPGIGRLLGADDGPGILEIFQRTASEEDIRRNSDFGFDYLPLSCGQTDPLVLLADKRARELLGEMRRRYDVIMIDGVSAVGNAETQLLVSLADQVILVLKWGSTELNVAQIAVREIYKAGQLTSKPVCASAILTQVDLRWHATYAGKQSDAADLWRPALPNKSRTHTEGHGNASTV